MKSKTIGFSQGHLLRRIIHISMFILPIIYYHYGDVIADYLYITKQQIVSLIVILILIFEVIRLKKNWLLLGQRSYETKQFSALAWGTIAIAFILLSAPTIGVYGSAIATPLIWCLSFVDPLLGELRGFKITDNIIILVGLTFIAFIWIICAFLLKTPWWLIPFMVPITLYSEWYKFPKIDDNATMLIIPYFFILLLLPWKSLIS